MPELLFDTCVLSDFALSASLPLLEVLCSQSAVITDLVAIASRRDCVFARGDRAAHKEATLHGVKLTRAIGILIKPITVG